MTASIVERASLEPDSGHIPVMLAEVLEAIKPKEGGRYLDATFGGGGYSCALLQSAKCHVWGIDRDPDAIERGNALTHSLLGQSGHDRLTLLPGCFGDMQELAGAFAPFDGIVLDLGVSSYQIDQAERGFSFKQEGPLDMRMSQAGQSAADLLRNASEEALADIIYHYGEERKARRIARAIVEARDIEPIETTQRLASLVRKIVRKDKSGRDPATRTFQALRIAVNDELGQLRRALEQAKQLLQVDGKLVVVTFHSLEDRIVKHFMQEAEGKRLAVSRHAPAAQTTTRAEFSRDHTKPKQPTFLEQETNVRARSAKLRVLSRVTSHSSLDGQVA